MMKIQFAVLLFAFSLHGQIFETNNVVVQTLAGSGFSGYVDGQGVQTMFKGLNSIVSDTQSNLFVFDFGNRAIRKITPSGSVSTVARGGGSMFDGFATNGMFYWEGDNENMQMTIDNSNNLYLLCKFNMLFRIGTNGYVTNIQVTIEELSNGSHGLCADSMNNIYLSDSNLRKVYRRRVNGVWEIFAGSGNSGSVDGNGIFTSFTRPTALTADTADNIYVWDAGTKLIRRINQNRDVVTITQYKPTSPLLDGVGTNISFYNVAAMSADSSGNIFLADGIAIRKMTASTNVTTVAGSFSQSGYVNGAGSDARFYGGDIQGICFSFGKLFLADTGNNRIRIISFNPSPELVTGPNLTLNTFAGLHLSGAVGRTYRIESSVDMKTWKKETTVLLTQSPFMWLDPTGLALKKYYRAFLLP